MLLRQKITFVPNENFLPLFHQVFKATILYAQLSMKAVFMH